LQLGKKASKNAEHMINGILQQLVTIFGVSAIVVILFHLLKQPAIAGFIIAGVLLGPSGFGWIEEATTIHLLADIGLIFLLFSIGIEFSVESLSSMWRAFLGVGSLQVLFTGLIACGILVALGQGATDAILLGLIVSLSSTAIALNLLHRKREILSPQGNLSIAVLLFQDLFAVPLLLVLPLFAGGVSNDGIWTQFFGSLVRALVLIGSVFIGSRFIVPFVLRFVTMTGVRELFLMAVAALIFGSAWLSAQVGLSVVFGAFLAGMLVSRTQYGHQVVADLVPLREPFVALFFVSVGMLLDFNHFLTYWPGILILALATIILKTMVGTLSAFVMRYDLRVATLMGLLLSQIGEFSFVIATAAFQIKAIDEFEYQTLLSVSVVTMLINPSLFVFAPRLIPRFLKNRFRRFFLTRRAMVEELADHVVIIGLGVTGQSVAVLLRDSHVPFVGVESDARLFHSLQKKNLAVIFGDGSRKEILEAAGVNRAKLVMVAINDANWTAHIVGAVRQLRPDVHVIVRCQHFRDMERLKNLDVDEFVVAEAQMAIEFSERVLRQFGLEQQTIVNTIEETKRDNYQFLREP
jgi:CPA2 family monovalent cation:H+ antiporter-2